MKFILETDRLLLREFEDVDAQSMFDLNSDPDVIRYTGDPAFVSINEVSIFLTSYSDYKRNGYGRWAVILKETNKFIGWCGLKLNEEGLVDIGFRFFKRHWGKGYASEAAEATLSYGFKTLNLDEILGRAVPDNLASISILEKLNMRYFKHDTCYGFENAIYYRISKEEFDKKAVKK